VVLVDTSSWVETLRVKDRTEVRDRVAFLARSGQAVWCDAVRLELWNGCGGQQEQKRLREMEQVIPRLPIDETTWSRSMALANRARSLGWTVPAMDLLIVACAIQHNADVESCDRHIHELRKLG